MSSRAKRTASIMAAATRPNSSVGMDEKDFRVNWERGGVLGIRFHVKCALHPTTPPAPGTRKNLTKSLNTAEAAEILGIRPATLRGWKAQRVGPPFIQLSPGVYAMLASMPIDQITAETIDVVKFRRPVIDRRTGKETGEMIECSRAYANQALRTLKSMIGKAKEWKVLSERPSFTIPEAPGRDVLIDDAAETAFERELGKSPTRSYARYRAWLVTMIMQDTGMRPSEVFEMRLENLRWAERRICIPSGKTAKARRFVGMTERMHELLSSWCHGDEGLGWLFPSRSKTGHLMSISGSFQGARERAGLDARIVPYSARHTYATYTVKATGNLFAVRDQVGHVDIKSMAPYQHQQTDELLVAINKRNVDRAALSGVGHTNSLTP